jgi:hypothetical protein
MTMSVNDQVLFDKLKSLPPQRRAEVEDFVDFLRTAKSATAPTRQRDSAKHSKSWMH